MLGFKGVDAVSAYVLSLNGVTVPPENLVPGKAAFDSLCSACHGADARGNVSLGAPNLVDGIWLYGGSLEAIFTSVAKGRSGVMPAWRGKTEQRRSTTGRGLGDRAGPQTGRAAMSTLRLPGAPVAWLGAIILLLVIAGCIGLILSATRYPDESVAPGARHHSQGSRFTPRVRGDAH